jgi:hypothetical protein
LSDIRSNYQKIQKRIIEACERAGRDPESVKTVVVTKFQPAWKINEVIRAGALQLGENYPEQLAQKIGEIDLSANPKFHMIGHLQSRKIKYIIEYFSMLHSIDSLETAVKLDKACEQVNIRLPVFIEVNIAGEDTKNGLDVNSKEKWDSVVDFANQINGLRNLDLVGLMTIPPFTKVGEINRPYFQQCRLLLNYINQKTDITGFKELSMGTSSDFEVAVEEGATFVRIGEAIMGSREN